MGRYILGLHSGHNASACIGERSGLIYAIQEERLTGEKNYWGTPKQAIQACLAGLSAKRGGSIRPCSHRLAREVSRLGSPSRSGSSAASVSTRPTRRSGTTKPSLR